MLPFLNPRLSNRLLALLLVLLSFRVGKSVMGMLMPDQLLLFSRIGVIAMSAVGPALFLFTRSFFDREFRLSPAHYLHFVPCLVPLFNAAWPTLNNTYVAYTLSVFIYIAVTVYFLVTRRELYRADDVKWRWIILLLIGITVLAITFVCQLLFYHPLVYQLIVITAAVVFYALSWWAIPRAKIFISDNRKKSTEVAPYQDVAGRITELLRNQHVYADANLTVSKLAAQLKVPPYVVSRAINASFDKSFSELILGYRIAKAEQMLLTDRSLTIEAIAYESGFNTLSAFYAAFKKLKGMTPAQFREKGASTKVQ